MNVFISYRHSDSITVAGRIRDTLKSRIGNDKVFIDVARIEPGANIDDEIFEDALNKSDVCLAVIGPNWVGAEDGAATTSIMKDKDYIRREISHFLDIVNKQKLRKINFFRKKLKIIPVFVKGGQLPSEDALPVELHPIRAIKGVPVRDETFDHDMKSVVNAVFSYKEPTRIDEFFERHPWLTFILKASAGFLIVLVLLIVVALERLARTGKGFLSILGEGNFTAALTVLLSLSLLLLGAALGAKFLNRK